MFVFPRTVAFRTAGNVFFRRYHFVVKLELVADCYVARKANGAFVMIPASGTTLLVGKKVKAFL